MDLVAIITMIALYSIFGIFTWQFWILVIIETYRSDDPDFQKLLNMSLIYFIFFWPLNAVIMLALLVHKK